jgi:hypothetical protein
MKTKNLTYYKMTLGLFSVLFLGACASTSQVAAIERQHQEQANKINELERQVLALKTTTQVLESNYQYVLDENKILREKLEGQVPLTFISANGILFEIMDVYRDGKTSIIEMSLTNKTDDNNYFSTTASKVSITDELGNLLKLSGFRHGSSAFDIHDLKLTLYPNAPVRFQMVLPNVKAEVKSIQTIGFDNYLTNGGSSSVRLSNVQIRD